MRKQLSSLPYLRNQEGKTCLFLAFQDPLDDSGLVLRTKRSTGSRVAKPL